MDKLGFGYAALAELNPKLVYCSISGFGESGPEAGRAGYDLVVQAESGLMDITGFPDGPPVKSGTSIADLVAGMSAAHGVVLALLARAKTRRGQKVEISMLDAMAALLTYQAGIYFATGQRPVRRGNAHPSIAPYESFTAADGYVTLGVANNSLWQRCCGALERPELAADPRYDTETKRVENRATLIPLLNEILSARTAEEWLKRFEAAGVPAGRIKSVPEVCESEHLKARGMIASSAPSVRGPGDGHGRSRSPALHARRADLAPAATRRAHRRDPAPPGPHPRAPHSPPPLQRRRLIGAERSGPSGGPAVGVAADCTRREWWRSGGPGDCTQRERGGLEGASRPLQSD